MRVVSVLNATHTWLARWSGDTAETLAKRGQAPTYAEAEAALLADPQARYRGNTDIIVWVNGFGMRFLKKG